MELGFGQRIEEGGYTGPGVLILDTENSGDQSIFHVYDAWTNVMLWLDGRPGRREERNAFDQWLTHECVHAEIYTWGGGVTGEREVYQNCFPHSHLRFSDLQPCWHDHKPLERKDKSDSDVWPFRPRSLHGMYDADSKVDHPYLDDEDEFYKGYVVEEGVTLRDFLTDPTRRPLLKYAAVEDEAVAYYVSCGQPADPAILTKAELHRLPEAKRPGERGPLLAT